MMTPLHHRVLIQPDPHPTETASGLALVEDFAPPDTSGTIIARGNGPRWAQEIRRQAIRECLALATENYDMDRGWFDLFKQFDDLLLATPLADPDVAVGDRVVFSPASGQIVELQDGRYLLMAEDDLLAVIGPCAKE
ncbi:MAG: co-chaperone GroES [Gemmatimonadaceae bacterium]|nr:co-chaperone GroES [Gemmatimonadaceae bacterium]